MEGGISVAGNRERLIPRRETKTTKKGAGVLHKPRGVGRKRGEYRRGKAVREGVRKGRKGKGQVGLMKEVREESRSRRDQLKKRGRKQK